jgi:hypothetical protein
MRENTARLAAGVLMKLISGLITALVAVLLLNNYGFFDPPIVKACEERMMGYFIAPSSYKRLGYILSERPFSKSEIEKRYLMDDATLETLGAEAAARMKVYQNLIRTEGLGFFKEGGLNPTVHSGIIEFRIKNKDNEFVNVLTDCKYYSDDGSISGMRIYDVHPMDVGNSNLLQVIQDRTELSTEEQQRYAEPIAPYRGWLHDIWRRLVN